MQPKSETDSDQSQVLRSRVPRCQCMRRRTVGTRRTLQGTSLQRHSSSPKWIQTQRDYVKQRRGPGGLKHIEIRCLAVRQWIRAKRYQWAEWERRTTQQISSRNIWMDRERSRSRRNFDCEFWMIRIVQMVTIDSFFFSSSFQSSRGVCTFSFQLTACTPHRI